MVGWEQELRDLAMAAVRSVSVRHVDAARHKKKRRIALIVVWWNQSAFQRLLLLDYQIRLDLARGVVLVNVCGQAKRFSERSFYE